MLIVHAEYFQQRSRQFIKKREVLRKWGRIDELDLAGKFEPYHGRGGAFHPISFRLTRLLTYQYSADELTQ